MMSLTPTPVLTGTIDGACIAPPYLEAFVGGTGLPPNLYCSGDLNETRFLAGSTDELFFLSSLRFWS